jgi:hypothetical protein
MPKRKSDMSVESDKKKLKVITLGTKLDIIKRFDNGQSKASIGRELGLSESTVRLIVSKCNEYKEQGKVASTYFSIRCTRNRSSILVEMENLLITWLEDCNQKRILVGTNNVRVKALSLFSSLKGNKFEGNTTICSVSRGFFEKFKARTGMHNVNLTVRRTLENGISCFRKMYEEKKKATSVQTKLDRYFSRK